MRLGASACVISPDFTGYHITSQHVTPRTDAQLREQTPRGRKYAKTDRKTLGYAKKTIKEGQQT